jgi:hypothetical protein
MQFSTLTLDRNVNWDSALRRYRPSRIPAIPRVFTAPISPVVDSNRIAMPESITTLPSELLCKVFGHLEHIGTATSLSQTCRRMHDEWLAHRRVLSMVLIPQHPVFWRFPEAATSDKTTTSLWAYARDYDDALGGRFSSPMLSRESNLHISDGNEDGSVTAKRIMKTARDVRAVARAVDSQICTYADEKGETRWPDVFQEKQYAIGRMLYKFLTRITTGQLERLAGPPDTLPQPNQAIDDDNLWELAAFVANHPELVPEGFPDLRGMINPKYLSLEERHRYRNGFYFAVIDAVRNDYQHLHTWNDLVSWLRGGGW